MCMHAQSLNPVTPWTVTHQTPLFLEFSRQEYWSGLPFHPLGDLPNPGIKPTPLSTLAMAGRFFTTELSGKPQGKTLLSSLFNNL